MRRSLTVSEGTQVAVAVATLGLAIATWRMARKTGDVATHTEAEAKAVAEQVLVANKQVQASSAQLRAAIRPWMAGAAPSQFPRVEQEHGEGNFLIGLTLKNVGNGLGLMQDGYIRAQDRAHELVQYPNFAFFNVPVVPVGGDVTIRFVVSPHSMNTAASTLDQLVRRPETYGEFWVHVLYTDADGQQRTWADVHVAGRREGDWVLDTIGYRRDGEEEAFVSVKYA